jgi:hypothetical protein
MCPTLPRPTTAPTACRVSLSLLWVRGDITRQLAGTAVFHPFFLRRKPQAPNEIPSHHKGPEKTSSRRCCGCAQPVIPATPLVFVHPIGKRADVIGLLMRLAVFFLLPDRFVTRSSRELPGFRIGSPIFPSASPTPTHAVSPERSPASIPLSSVPCRATSVGVGCSWRCHGRRCSTVQKSARFASYYSG